MPSTPIDNFFGRDRLISLPRLMAQQHEPEGTDDCSPWPKQIASSYRIAITKLKVGWIPKELSGNIHLILE
ncbi:MAG: hypothetical protein AAGE59_25470 [Cyanobacteria bacterium P01_F01_bin.86]